MVRQAGVVGGLLGTVALFGLLCAPRFGLLRRHFESLGFEAALESPAAALRVIG
jgi:hypothetical protein